MTQQEFQDLTGRKVTAEEFCSIEKMYYAVPNMDKHEFCKRWLQTGNNPLTIELAKQTILLNGMLEERNNEAEDCHSKMEELAWFLIGKACAYEDIDFYKEAIRIVGLKTAIMHKIKMGYPLWKEDKEYIRENLK
ncbi:MAG: hypothetical protein IJ342_07070 [Muribaculaceae bacterium]|nr:hypothetical protein [Bacteroidaceae bacterium]MBQ7852612.1 hypothetical protein [Muribaculaceae bacterium]